MDIAKTLSAESRDRIALARKEVTLDVAQEGGLVRLMVDGPFRHGNSGYQATYDFKVRVPRDIKLDLRTVNRSHIRVEGTSGDFTIDNVNGEIEMRDIEGSGSVHTVNGPVTVTFARNPVARLLVQIGERQARRQFPLGLERRHEDENLERGHVYRFSGIHAAREHNRAGGAQGWKIRVAQPSHDGCSDRQRWTGVEL